MATASDMESVDISDIEGPSLDELDTNTQPTTQTDTVGASTFEQSHIPSPAKVLTPKLGTMRARLAASREKSRQASVASAAKKKKAEGRKRLDTDKQPEEEEQVRKTVRQETKKKDVTKKKHIRDKVSEDTKLAAERAPVEADKEVLEPAEGDARVIRTEKQVTEVEGPTHLNDEKGTQSSDVPSRLSKKKLKTPKTKKVKPGVEPSPPGGKGLADTNSSGLVDTAPLEGQTTAVPESKKLLYGAAKVAYERRQRTDAEANTALRSRKQNKRKDTDALSEDPHVSTPTKEAKVARRSAKKQRLEEEKVGVSAKSHRKSEQPKTVDVSPNQGSEAVSNIENDAEQQPPKTLPVRVEGKISQKKAKRPPHDEDAIMADEPSNEPKSKAAGTSDTGGHDTPKAKRGRPRKVTLTPVGGVTQRASSLEAIPMMSLEPKISSKKQTEETPKGSTKAMDEGFASPSGKIRSKRMSSSAKSVIIEGSQGAKGTEGPESAAMDVESVPRNDAICGGSTLRTLQLFSGLQRNMMSFLRTQDALCDEYLEQVRKNGTKFATERSNEKSNMCFSAVEKRAVSNERLYNEVLTAKMNVRMYIEDKMLEFAEKISLSLSKAEQMENVVLEDAIKQGDKMAGRGWENTKHVVSNGGQADEGEKQDASSSDDSEFGSQLLTFIPDTNGVDEWGVIKNVALLKRYLGNSYNGLGLSCYRSASILKLCEKAGGMTVDELHRITPMGIPMLRSKVKGLLEKGFLIYGGERGVSRGANAKIYMTSPSVAIYR